MNIDLDRRLLGELYELRLRRKYYSVFKSAYADFDDSLPVQISMVGEGTEEEDGDGYVNYIYRVQTPKESLVLKQGTRNQQGKPAENRNIPQSS